MSDTKKRELPSGICMKPNPNYKKPDSDSPTIVEKVKSKFFQTAGMLKARGERVEPKPGRRQPLITQEDLGRGVPERDKDAKIVLGWASDKQLHKLAEEIRAERAKLPKFWYGICTNKNCGFRFGFSGPDSHEGPCLFCNFQNFKDGGFMREMSKGEVEEFEKEKAAYRIRALAEMKKERELLKQDFNLRVARGEFR